MQISCSIVVFGKCEKVWNSIDDIVLGGIITSIVEQRLNLLGEYTSNLLVHYPIYSEFSKLRVRHLRCDNEWLVCVMLKNLLMKALVVI